MKTKKIVIIGSGPGGYVAAIRAASMGADVTLVEGEKLGGTCLNRGCIPSKIMKTAAEMLLKLKHPETFGLSLSGKFEPDLKMLMARKEKVIENQSRGIEALFKKLKVQVRHGFGSIKSMGQVKVESPGREPEIILWDSLIIATGAKPMELPAIPFDGKQILSSDHIFAMESIPESMIIVGGGVIGCEFASILSALGSKVKLIEAGPSLLPFSWIDGESAPILKREMKKQKIEVFTKSTVAKVEPAGNKLRTHLEPAMKNVEDKDSMDNGLPKKIITADAMLVCIGRTPNSKGLGLKQIGISTDHRGSILVNEKMATTVSNVFAIGDVLGPSKIMLAHCASFEGVIAAENIMGKNRIMKYSLIPNAVFTIPEIASVGHTEESAKEKYPGVQSDTVLFRHIGKAHVIQEFSGQAKIISDRAKGKILGVHLIGPHATDLIAEGVLAIQKGCTVKELANTIHAHPTLSEIFQETAWKAMGLPIHG